MIQEKQRDKKKNKVSIAMAVYKYIETYELNGWHLYQNEENQGFCMNFFRCIEKTTGDIVFLCDQDDIWKPRKIEYMEKVMLQYPQISVLNTGVELIDAHDMPLNKRFIERRTKLGSISKVEFIEVTGGNIAPGCSLCFCADIREKFLLQKNFEFPHDWCINIMGILKPEGGTYFWNREFTRYRIHENNTIGIHKPIKLKQNFIEQRIAQGEFWEKCYENVILLVEGYYKKKLVWKLRKKQRYHMLRTEALRKKQLGTYFGSLLLKLLGMGEKKITIKMVFVDMMYIMGIKYH